MIIEQGYIVNYQEQPNGGLVMKMYDQMTLNSFLNLFSSEVLFLIRYRGVVLACTSNMDDRALSFYYPFTVQEYQFYPESKFVTVAIGD